jgi:hypothetical protein
MTCDNQAFGAMAALCVIDPPAPMIGAVPAIGGARATRLMSLRGAQRRSNLVRRSIRTVRLLFRPRMLRRCAPRTEILAPARVTPGLSYQTAKRLTHAPYVSWPRLSRPSTSLQRAPNKDMGGRPSPAMRQKSRAIRELVSLATAGPPRTTLCAPSPTGTGTATL